MTEVKPEDALGLTLRREGLFSWKLSRIILPKSFFDKDKSQAADAGRPTAADSLKSLVGQYPPDIFKTEYGQQLREHS